MIPVLILSENLFFIFNIILVGSLFYFDNDHLTHVILSLEVHDDFPMSLNHKKSDFLLQSSGCTTDEI